ncbi:unnamed protein product [Schistosoma margrebowiei]|uniref:Uncharacterized protein n=1 Tax=Schistosoma margrebowiei TaxID=48269 RepID=A0AA85AL67_9TREM|nr:unnamed protein product [Schistosoma margrebowiei]
MTLTAWNTLPISTVDVNNLLNTDFNMYTTEPLLPEEWVKFQRILVGNWTDEKPYEVKSRELCPEKQNNTQRAPLSIANVNHKLSSTGSSGNRVHKRRPNSICTQNYLRNTLRIWMSGKENKQKFSKSVRDGSGYGYVQGQHNG